MNQIAHLVIQVSSSQVGAAQAALGSLGLQAQVTEASTNKVARASDGLMGTLTRLAASIGVTTLAYKGLVKLFTVSKEFQSLEAQLKTATGSAEDAAIAFEAISDFATTTPFDLQQATESFISLVNLGLNPSERAMTSYGNTASALGRDMSDMVNAVAKATTGEFEPLKSFGIKARKEADGVVFTFRGLSTKVGNTTKEIEDYFIQLGETNFAGAMTERMKTLEGQTSNLGDAWDKLFYQIGKAGAGEAMGAGITKVTLAIEELTKMVMSGELVGYIDALKAKFASFGEAASNIIDFFAYAWKVGMKEANKESDSAVSYIIKAFFRIPESIAAVAKMIGATLGVVVEYAVAVGSSVYNAFMSYFKLLSENTKTVFSAIWEAMKDPLNASTVMAVAMAKSAVASDAFADSIKENWRQTYIGIKTATGAYGEVMDEILRTATAETNASAAAVDAAKKRREEYEKMLIVQKELEAFFGKSDRLAGYSTNTGQEDTRTQAQKDALRDLKIALGDEEAAVALSYQKRVEIINEGTLAGAAGEEERAAAMAMLNERIALEYAQAADQKTNRLYAEYQAEQKILANALTAKEITETEFREKSIANWSKYQGKVGQIASTGAQTLKVSNLQMLSDVLGMAGNIANQMAALVEGNNAAAKAMFVVSKGIAIAQAIVNTELAATKALAEGGMYAGIPMASIIRAMGYASVGVMAAQAVMEYKGKFATGGYIPQGSYGLVGETGEAEAVRGPAMVTSVRATADHRLADRGGSNFSVNIHNYTGAEVTTQERETPNGKVVDILIKKVEGRLASAISSGGTPLSRAIERSYGLNRANQL